MGDIAIAIGFSVASSVFDSAQCETVCFYCSEKLKFKKLQRNPSTHTYGGLAWHFYHI